MTKPKIEDFIPPGWYAAMDQSGDLIISINKPSKLKRFWAVAGVSYTQIDTKHASFFDLSIFGDDWEKSLWQKPPELQPCPVCGGEPIDSFFTSEPAHKRVACPKMCITAKADLWNRLRYEAE